MTVPELRCGGLKFKVGVAVESLELTPCLSVQACLPCSKNIKAGLRENSGYIRDI